MTRLFEAPLFVVPEYIKNKINVPKYGFDASDPLDCIKPFVIFSCIQNITNSLVFT